MAAGELDEGHWAGAGGGNFVSEAMIAEEDVAIDADEIREAGEVCSKDDGKLTCKASPRDPNAPSPCETCTGHCCRMFYLGYTWQELIDIREQSLKSTGVAAQKQVAEIDLILKRFVPLYVPPGNHRGSRSYGRDLSLPHTCRSYNPKTGRCMDYATRPQLCHAFKCGAFHVEVGKEDEYHKTAVALTAAMFYGGGRFKQSLVARILDFPITVSCILWWMYGGPARNQWVLSVWYSVRSKPSSLWSQFKNEWLESFYETVGYPEQSMKFLARCEAIDDCTTASPVQSDVKEAVSV